MKIQGIYTGDPERIGCDTCIDTNTVSVECELESAYRKRAMHTLRRTTLHEVKELSMVAHVRAPGFLRAEIRVVVFRRQGEMY